MFSHTILETLLNVYGSNGNREQFLLSLEQVFMKICNLIEKYEGILVERDRKFMEHDSAMKKILQKQWN